MLVFLSLLLGGLYMRLVPFFVGIAERGAGWYEWIGFLMNSIDDLLLILNIAVTEYLSSSLKKPQQ